MLCIQLKIHEWILQTRIGEQSKIDVKTTGHFPHLLFRLIGKPEQQLIRTRVSKALADHTLQKLRIFQQAGEVGLLLFEFFSSLYEF